MFCLQTAYILPQYCKEEEFEDTKGIIRICKSKKERHHNGQAKKDKRTNNDLQNTTQKTKRWRKMNQTKTEGDYKCFVYKLLTFCHSIVEKKSLKIPYE